MVNFFVLPLWIPGENRAKLKKLFKWQKLFEQQKEVGSTIPQIYRIHFVIVLSPIALMQAIFWTEYFCFISGCGNSFNCKLKKLINEQIVIFYSSSHALCSCDEICTDKLSIILSFACVPFPLGSISKYRISVNEEPRNVRYRKNQILVYH